MIGIVIASLIIDVINKDDLERLDLFIDGELLTPKRTFVKEVLSEISPLKRRDIILHHGANFDKLYYIVNVADCMAHIYGKKALLKNFLKILEEGIL